MGVYRGWDHSEKDQTCHGRNLFYFLHVHHESKHKSPYCFSKQILLKNVPNHQYCKTSRTRLKEAALWSSCLLLPRHPYSHLASGLPENDGFPPSWVSYQQIPTKFLTLPYFLNIQISSLCYLHFVPLGLDPQALGSPGTLVPSPDAPVSLWPGLPWLVGLWFQSSGNLADASFSSCLRITHLPVCTSWRFTPGPMFLSCTEESVSGAHVTW